MKSKKLNFAVLFTGVLATYFCGYFLIFRWDRGNHRVLDLLVPCEETLITIYQPLLEMSMKHHAKIRELNLTGSWRDASNGITVRVSPERDVEVSGFDKYGIKDGSKTRGKLDPRGYLYAEGFDGRNWPAGPRLVLDTWDKNPLHVRISRWKALKGGEFHLPLITGP